jgi:hypothetical protein
MIEKEHQEQIENALVDGIRKTINRFRERPLNYFTESDIHSSLMKDIMAGNSKIFLFKDDNFPEVSLVHNEYPTNFRYKKAELLNGYNEDDRKVQEQTKIDVTTGDRGNFDLSILNRDFVKDMFTNPVYLKNKQEQMKDMKDMKNMISMNESIKNIISMNESIKNIINKDIAYPKQRKVRDQNKFKGELLYAIEVKFIHPFNARNVNMLKEVVKDNAKLKLTKIHSGGKTKVLNLIFCSSDKLKRKDDEAPIITQIKGYVSQYEEEKIYKPEFKKINKKQAPIPNEVINIFIESYIFKDLKKDSKDLSKKNKDKETPKPIISIGGNNLNDMFYKRLKKALKI